MKGCMGYETPSIDPYIAKLDRFELSSTQQCYYLIGCNKENTEYRVLKMDRTLIEREGTALTDFLVEDPNLYTQAEIKSMLEMLNAGNRVTTRADGRSADRPNAGGLKAIVKAYGILGFIRFLDCYYLTLITRRSKVGDIGGNAIYTIKVRHGSTSYSVGSNGFAFGIPFSLLILPVLPKH
jgi:phosphatidylinositol 3,5-bisphosphate 5-phosphatase